MARVTINNAAFAGMANMFIGGGDRCLSRAVTVETRQIRCIVKDDSIMIDEMWINCVNCIMAGDTAARSFAGTADQDTG